jgi:hypothetical protein
MSSKLPSELALVAQLIDAQPPDVQELFQYALVMLMVQDGKAEIIEHKTTDREYLTVRTIAGELFSLAKPDVGEDQLKGIEQMVQEVLEADSRGKESS